MDPNLKLNNQLDRALNDLMFGVEYSDVRLNYKEHEGERNWLHYDKFLNSISRLKIAFVSKSGVDPEKIEKAHLPKVAELYKCIIQWMFAGNLVFRFFPPRFFRQAEMLYGLVTIQGEKLKLMTHTYYMCQSLKPIEEFDPLTPMNSEIYFFNKKNRLQSMDRMAFFLMQQALLERNLTRLLFSSAGDQGDDFTQQADLVNQHYDHQIEFLGSQILKFWELDPELKSSWDIQQTPTFHYLEKFLDFQRVFKAAMRIDREFFLSFLEDLQKLCTELDLGERAHKVETKLVLSPDEKREYAAVSAQVTDTYSNKVKELLSQQEKDNDMALKSVYNKLFKQERYEDMFNTGVYELYMAEMDRIQWHLEDIKNLVDSFKNDVSITDNDYQLLDIIKEIAYCEGVGYTIGYNNTYHAGRMHPFNLWNALQCHEELKHFHTVRAVLNGLNVRTDKLDEEFIADSFNEPNPDLFDNQYNVFLINFLAELHNIRAYVMLSNSLDNPEIKQVMKLIAEDEVVHKKIFAAHFKYLCQRDPQWAKNSFDCLMDNGFGKHQAQASPHYKILMNKIGKYYGKSGKTDALKFLNQSMRAQYLELKSLFDPEVFTVSEYDFRQKHLKAFVA